MVSEYIKIGNTKIIPLHKELSELTYFQKKKTHRSKTAERRKEDKTINHSEELKTTS